MALSSCNNYYFIKKLTVKIICEWFLRPRNVVSNNLRNKYFEQNMSGDWREKQ